MKAPSFGNLNKGFSTLEIMIALVIMMIVLSGAASANFAAEYWSITSETSNEALYKAKTKLENLRALVKQDFYQATSSPLLPDACVYGQLCYFIQTTVTDLSSCSKYAQANVAWQVGGYPTTTTSLFTNLTNTSEAIAEGGDCLLNEPEGGWDTSVPQSVGVLNFTPGEKFTGIDVLHKKIYAISSVAPYFSVYNSPTAVGTDPVFVGSTTTPYPLNSVDAYEDLSTGRKYAFVTEATTSNQLGVIDITDATAPVMVAERTLAGVNPGGSFPEGWRAVAYGGRLYVVTRDTTGPEFHMFNINVPTQPTEIGAGFELTRTVHDMIIRDQKVAGVVHRFVFLASSADTKELSVLDVTGDSVTEVASVNLPGSHDGKSVFLLGNTLYFGRENDPGGPELFAFDVTNPAVPLQLGTGGEVGMDVDRLKVSGKFLFVGAYKLFSESQNEVQIWNSDPSKWNPSVLNAGRFQTYNFPNLAPLGLDIDGDWIYAASNLAAHDTLQVFYNP